MAYMIMKPYFNLWRLLPVITVAMCIPIIIGFPSRLIHQDEYLYQNEAISSSAPQILPKTTLLDDTSKEEYEVTAYCLNTNPMANGKKVHNGAIACPAFLPFGTKVIINHDKLIDNEFICEDRMAIQYRHGKYIDIWVENCDVAMDFGRNKILVEIVSSNK